MLTWIKFHSQQLDLRAVPLATTTIVTNSINDNDKCGPWAKFGNTGNGRTSTIQMTKHFSSLSDYYDMLVLL